MANKIIEVNGIKLEVDLSTAKVVNSYKVGDKIKLLKKVYSDYKVFPAMIIGFEPFEKLPTIVVAYLDVTYGDAKLEVMYLNTETKDVEIVPAVDKDFGLDKSFILEAFDRKLEAKKQEIRELENRKTIFLREFGAYFDADAIDGHIEEMRELEA